MKKTLLIITLLTIGSIGFAQPGKHSLPDPKPDIIKLAATKNMNKIVSFAHLLYYSIADVDVMTDASVPEGTLPAISIALSYLRMPYSAGKEGATNTLLDRANATPVKPARGHGNVPDYAAIREVYVTAFNDLIEAGRNNQISLDQVLITEGPDAGIGRTFEWVKDNINVPGAFIDRSQAGQERYRKYIEENTATIE